MLTRKMLVVALLLGCFIVISARGQATQPIDLNIQQYERVRVLKAADQYLNDPPITITSFPATRSTGGIHDFYSEADYDWPNPKDPTGPYIGRDGESNPTNFNDHRAAMRRLSIEVPALVSAYVITGDRK